MRQRYESSGDRANEELIAREFACKWQASYHKLPMSYVLDYAFVRGQRIVGYMECKRRTNKMNQYPTIFIAQKKVEQAALVEAATGMKTVFAVKWADATGYLMLNDPDYFAIGGRSDRNDSADQEPMAHFAVSRVTLI